MKKYILAVSLLTFSPFLNAGLWDSIATSNFKDVNPKVQYKVETYGFNMRVYEFTSQIDPNIICIAAFTGGDTNAFQMQCVKK